MIRSRCLFAAAAIAATLAVFSGCDRYSLFDVLDHDLTLVPSEVELAADKVFSFSVLGAAAPFSFTIESGGGRVSRLGEFTSPAVAGLTTVTLNDNSDRTAQSTVTTLVPIVLNPASATVNAGGMLTIDLSGGAPDFSISPGPSVTPASPFAAGPIILTAGPTAGTEIITVTDSLGQSAEAVITVVSPGTPLAITPSTTQVLVGGFVQLSGSGGDLSGDGDYAFSLAPAGFGTLTPGAPPVLTAKYDAPADLTPFAPVDTAVITVTDDLGATAEATIYVVDAFLEVVPSPSITLSEGDTYDRFSAINGTPPYTFSIDPADAADADIDPVSGIFTAIAFNPSVQVIVTDAKGVTATCKVKILK